MAREIVIWCDEHLRTEEHVPAAPHTFTIDQQTYEVDLCAECVKALVGPLLALCEDAAQPVKPEPKAERKAGKRARVATCPICEATYSSRGAVIDHGRTAHGEDIAKIETERGVNVYGHKLAHKCPECGLAFSRPQGLGAHRKHVHDVDAIA